MKNWKTINITKKTMIDNLKISFFNNDNQNIHIYICEFIVNNQTDTLLETLIELYCDYYSSLNIKTLNKINTCIDIVNNKNKYLYLEENRNAFNDLGNDLNNLIKTKALYKKKYETKLLYDPDIIINKLNKINYNIWNNIKQYVPIEQHKYFLELLYLLSDNNKEQFNNLLNTIINKFNKTKLIKNIETLNQNFNDNYILIFFELFKNYKNLYNNHKINNYYDLYYNIFNYKLKKSNINNRISIIFLLFDLLFADKNKNTYYHNKIKLDLSLVNNIYLKLIEFYELPKEIKEPKKRSKPRKKSSNTNNDTKNSESDNETTTSNKSKSSRNNPDNDINVDYLYNIININNKEIKRKRNKVNNNKFKLNNSKIIQKPINIDGDEKIFSSYINNDIDIIKLNNRIKKY